MCHLKCIIFTMWKVWESNLNSGQSSIVIMQTKPITAVENLEGNLLGPENLGQQVLPY